MTAQKPNVLYVEDNTALQSLMEHALTSCEVVPALTGEAAVDILNEYPAFNMILVDINLGDGMDGIELCRLIRSRDAYKQTPVIAITAIDYSRIGEHIHPEMFNECLTKPFKIQDILRLREQYLTTNVAG